MASDLIPFPEQAEPIVRRSGDDFVASWPRTYPYLTMRFRNPYEDKQGVHAELGVFISMPGFPARMEWGKLNMMAAQTRAQTANRLVEQWQGPGAPPFRSLLTEACSTVVDVIREGEPFEQISSSREVPRPEYALAPLAPENKITTVFGDGAVGKGWLCLSCCLSIQEGTDLLGFVPNKRANALYLDWENDNDEQSFRTTRLAQGYALDSWRNIHYRQMHGTLHAQSAVLRRFIDDNDIGFVVVDSVGAAIGADLNDASEIIKAYSVMRSFGCTVLAVDHVSKGESGGRPTGSNYKFHYSRAMWEVKKAQEAGTDELRIALINHKNNNGKLAMPVGFQVDFIEEDGPVVMQRFDIRADPTLAAHTSTPNRILFIVRQRPSSFSEIMEELKVATPDLKENTVSQAIKRLVNANPPRIGVGPGGKYGLLASR